MKRRLIHILAIVSVLSVFLPMQVTPTEGSTSDPFVMRVLNEQGQGIPNIRVISDNGIVCRTQADGSVRWTERSVMNRDVRFRLDGANGGRDVTLHPTAGGRADVSFEGHKPA